ncbi:hypothetical protein M3Y99_00647000 [Aphelenchoides fujianensis]|nr:hypothetical protein M3Y99_00647000 [Aphelenchoides fujianensis]
MTKLRLMFVLFVCAAVPLAVQTAATLSAANETTGKGTTTNETALVAPNMSAMAPLFREGFEAGRKLGFAEGNRTAYNDGLQEGFCLGVFYALKAIEKLLKKWDKIYFVVYVVIAAALLVCVLLLCCCGKNEKVSGKTPASGAPKKNAVYV